MTETVKMRAVELSFKGQLRFLGSLPSNLAQGRTTFTMWECPECAALVLPDMIAKHVRYHGAELVSVGSFDE
jgi:hypothetical protein